MGVPIIVSDINVCIEIIVNNINGKIIAVKSVQVIYDAMIEMYTDEHLYIKQKTKAILKLRYECKIFWDLLLSDYNLLLKE